jgi:ketosteroid isomerase-like protein
MHFGPTAQDFYAAFELGDSDLAIGLQDADGVALAAIQGLNAKLNEQAAVLADRDARIAALESQLGELRRAVEMLAARGTPELTLARR